MYGTARTTIEPLAPDHAEGLFAALDYPEIGEQLGRPDVTTLASLREAIPRLIAGPRAGPAHCERWWNYAVRLAASATIIGRLEATTHGDWGEIAYVFGPPWWHQGLGSETARWLIDHLAGHGFTELWAAVRPANLASRRLLVRAGFVRAADPARRLASFRPGDDTFVRLPTARPP